MFKQNGIAEFEHVICGGGLVGVVWALYLRRRSNSVALFESYYDLRQQLIPGGRSINLVLSRKALDPLQELGIIDQVLKNTIPIKGQTLHPSTGDNYKLCYGLTEEDNTFCIARNKLNECLLDIAESNNIPIFFEHTLIAGDLQKNQYVFRVRNYDEQTELRVKAKHMYGTDGAGSKVRELLLKQKGKQANIQWYPADYKQLFLPIDSEKDDYPFDPHWVHVWPRGGQVLMGHPNANKSFSLTLILPSKGPNSFESLDTQQKIQAYFNTNLPQLIDKIPNFSLQFLENPIGYLGTIKCPIWHYKDKVVILGDAAHTICPFLWQAVNSGMDDCFNLDKIIDKYGFTQKAFEQYFNLQKPKADALADMTINNFETLATLGNQQQFIKLKEIQKQVERACPDNFWSKYRMIFFGDRPYNEISVLHKKFQAFLEQSKDKLTDPQKRRLLILQQEFKKLTL